jgi:nucleotide-binding universal stress UspA family protein
MGRTAQSDEGRSGIENSILVPLFENFDIEYAITIAGRASRELKQPVTLATLLVVPRSMPLTAPMAEEEEAALALLQRAEKAARQQGMRYARHVERVRDAEEGLLQVIKKYRASNVIVGAFADHIRDEQFVQLVDILLQRAPCNVVIVRQAPDQQHRLE